MCTNSSLSIRIPPGDNICNIQTVSNLTKAYDIYSSCKLNTRNTSTIRKYLILKHVETLFPTKITNLNIKKKHQHQIPKITILSFNLIYIVL